MSPASPPPRTREARPRGARKPPPRTRETRPRGGRGRGGRSGRAVHWAWRAPVELPPRARGGEDVHSRRRGCPAESPPPPSTPSRRPGRARPADSGGKGPRLARRPGLALELTPLRTKHVGTGPRSRPHSRSPPSFGERPLEGRRVRRENGPQRVRCLRAGEYLPPCKDQKARTPHIHRLK